MKQQYNNFRIKLNLLKLKGAFMKHIPGEMTTGECKRYIVIPVDDNDSIFMGEKGCYLNLSALEMQNPLCGNTHRIKCKLADRIAEKQNDKQHFIGNMRPVK